MVRKLKPEVTEKLRTFGQERTAPFTLGEVVRATGVSESTLHFRLNKMYGMRPDWRDEKLNGHPTGYYSVSELMEAIARSR